MKYLRLSPQDTPQNKREPASHDCLHWWCSDTYTPKLRWVCKFRVNTCVSMCFFRKPWNQILSLSLLDNAAREKMTSCSNPYSLFIVAASWFPRARWTCPGYRTFQAFQSNRTRVPSALRDDYSFLIFRTRNVAENMLMASRYCCANCVIRLVGSNTVCFSMPSLSIRTSSKDTMLTDLLEACSRLFQNWWLKVNS